MNWNQFVEASRSFFDTNRGCPMFQLIEVVDELYRVAYTKDPFPTTGIEINDFFRMCFLICHRSLLSAAMCTGSGLPEDGAAITRRALEAAKACLASKAHPDNFQAWKAIEVRKGRWKSRAKGDKPRGSVTLRYKHVSAEPLYQDLQWVIGSLSDFMVHFTPEHVGQYEWEQIRQRDGTTETSFGLDEDAVAKEFLMIAGQHRLIMRVFDHCLDGKLLQEPAVRELARRVLDLYKELLRREGFTEEATTAGKSW